MAILVSPGGGIECTVVERSGASVPRRYHPKHGCNRGAAFRIVRSGFDNIPASDELSLDLPSFTSFLYFSQY
jgi:hypothetical protein